MKALLRTTTIIAMTILLMSTAAGAKSIDTDPKERDAEATISKIETIDTTELLNSLEESHIDLQNNLVTYEIYDSSDLLIHQVTTKKNTVIGDKKFVSLINQSDFFMELDNTLIYRLSR